MQVLLKSRQYKMAGIIGLILIVGVMGGIAYFKRATPPAATETIATVGRGDIRTIVSATGTISPVNSVDISSQVTGLIKQVYVAENDKVQAGQVLVMLDDSSLQAQVDQYRTQMLNFAAIYERSQKIVAIGGISSQQMETDRTNYRVAQATYQNFAAQLKYYVINSPIDGMVIGKPIPAGQTVAQGISSPQVIMTIADMSKMQIKVLVDESDIGKAKLGQKVEFTVDSYPDTTFTGKIALISRSATTQSNVVYYPVYVDVDSAEGLLYPTMTARVSIHIGESKNAIVVPLSAIKETAGKKYVQKLLEGKQQQVLVQTGLSDDTMIEILAGLNEGDSILVPVAKAKTTTNQNMPMGPPPM